MPIHWTIDSRTRLVTAIAEGEIEVAEFLALLDVVGPPPVLSYRKLFDGSRAVARMTPEEQLVVGVRVRSLQTSGARLGPLAVVVRDERYQMVARMLGILAVPERPMRAFSDPAKARAWLDSPAVVASVLDGPDCQMAGSIGVQRRSPA